MLHAERVLPEDVCRMKFFLGVLEFPLEPDGQRQTRDEEEKLVKILHSVREKNWTIHVHTG